MTRTNFNKAFAVALTLLFLIVTATIDLNEYRAMNDHGKLVVQQGNENEIAESHSGKTKIIIAVDPTTLDQPIYVFRRHLSNHSFKIAPIINLCHALRAPPYRLT